MAFPRESKKEMFLVAAAIVGVSIFFFVGSIYALIEQLLVSGHTEFDKQGHAMLDSAQVVFMATFGTGGILTLAIIVIVAMYLHDEHLKKTGRWPKEGSKEQFRN